MQELDQRDRELLHALQHEVPIVSTPFAVVGQIVDMSEKEVLKRAEKLKRDGILHHISADFDPRSVGYNSCLVAARVDSARIDEAAERVSAHPGVSQNYRRNHDFNVWFTIAVPPTSKLGLEKTVSLLGDESGCDIVRRLPMLQTFKTSSSSDHSDSSHEGFSEPGAAESRDRVPSGEEIEAIRLLQSDLPLLPRPFEGVAKSGGMEPETLLALARQFLARKQIRRFAATVAERKGGFSSSVLAVWRVPAAVLEEVGTKMAAFKAVSHCYVRPTYEDWPYNMFTTVHGRSVDECDSVLRDIASATGVSDRCALYPTKEYKKAKLTLFSAENEEWEAARLAFGASSAAS